MILFKKLLILHTLVFNFFLKSCIAFWSTWLCFTDAHIKSSEDAVFQPGIARTEEHVLKVSQYSGIGLTSYVLDLIIQTHLIFFNSGWSECMYSFEWTNKRLCLHDALVKSSSPSGLHSSWSLSLLIGRQQLHPSLPLFPPTFFPHYSSCLLSSLIICMWWEL